MGGFQVFYIYANQQVFGWHREDDGFEQLDDAETLSAMFAAYGGGRKGKWGLVAHVRRQLRQHSYGDVPATCAVGRESCSCLPCSLSLSEPSLMAFRVVLVGIRSIKSSSECLSDVLAEKA